MHGNLFPYSTKFEISAIVHAKFLVIKANLNAHVVVGKMLRI